MLNTKIHMKPGSGNGTIKLPYDSVSFNQNILKLDT